MADRSLTLRAVGEVLRSAGLLREAIGPEDIAVLGTCQDSREARPGDLFLAWRGINVDAHEFVADAVAAGAVAAVVEHRVDTAVPQLVVEDGRRAAALVADLLVASPWQQLFTVAITGTNGKTTTSLLVRHLCGGPAAAVAIGTLGVVDARGVRPGSEGLTTPGPVQVSGWLRELTDEGVHTVVMEASSHALEQRRLDGVRFDVAVFTNLTQDHLDYHTDLDEYLAAKARLVELVKPQGTLVVNGDDPAWAALSSGDHRVRTFAVDADADVRAEDVTLGSGGSTFALVADGLKAHVQLPLLGRYNVENALAAAAVALVAGMAFEDVAEGLRSVPQPTGRLEAVLRRPFTVLIDFAHTPHALEGALGAVKPLTRGRLIVVFGAGGDRDRMKRRPMAEAVRRFADIVVLTSDNPRTEDPERILDDLATGLEGLDYARIADRRSAIRHALEIAREGDTVVLAGKGHETYQVLGREKRPFDERVVVRECLAELGVA
ncbi:MAG: UDP-N-acetylmuramoyl-L-alanyl-D-glutamate--2,6-diaminopimelate ligase [Gemmatimonadetes bacterium]|nr:UDP-N-acetylmuramoyl-L-alanyl-D-glutamate--2,6-diaminopimelate ligase [Gemmatimonadota bacterium]